MCECEGMVPESRLREVEAENAQLRRIIEQRANGTDLLTEQLRADLAALVDATGRALDELGVPQPGYPMPVVNAVDILTAARAVLARHQEGV